MLKKVAVTILYVFPCDTHGSGTACPATPWSSGRCWDPHTRLHSDTSGDNLLEGNTRLEDFRPGVDLNTRLQFLHGRTYVYHTSSLASLMDNRKHLDQHTCRH